MKSLLSGIRIVDLSRVLAGPYGTLLLGDLGAEIIKIEDPREGDPTRNITPQKVQGEDPYFLGLNRNKKSVTLNLTAPKGREIFHGLVKISDVVYDNYRPDVLEKLGADYETLKKVNPKVISCSISGFGHQSIVPYQAFKTQDIWIVVAVFVEKFWSKFCKVLGLENIASDPRFDKNPKRLQNKTILVPILEEAILKWKGEDLLKRLDEEDVPAAPVNTLDRILSNPQILTRNMVVEVNHPKVGKFKSVGNPIKVSRFPQETFQPPPMLGQHNESIYRDLLGYSSADLQTWKKGGII